MICIKKIDLEIGYVSEIKPFGLKNIGGYEIIISDEYKTIDEYFEEV